MPVACLSGVSEGELVRRAAHGDGEAYGTLVARYYAPCARYAYRALGNREDVEDALQETFLRAYRALRRYEERGAFRAWVLRILVNECRTLASRRRRRERFQVWSDAALGAAEAPRAPEVDETADELQRALLRLPPPGAFRRTGPRSRARRGEPPRGAGHALVRGDARPRRRAGAARARRRAG